MPRIELLKDSKSQHLTVTQNGQQAYFSTIDLKYAYGQLQLLKDTAKLILISFEENTQARTDLKSDFTVSRTCQLNFKKHWITLL